MPTSLPPIDWDQVRALWQRALSAGAVAPGTAEPEVAGPFGDHAELADELFDLVAQGTKRATVGAVADYDYEGVPIPDVGSRWIVVDGASRPRAVLRCTEMRIGPMSSVDDAFAWDEGENDRTRAGWLDAHTRFFCRYLPTIGVEFDPDLELVFQRFAVDYLE